MGKEMIAMLLAGGQGSRLYALTQKLAKPAVYNLLKKKEFRWIQLDGGKYRISKKSFDDWLDKLEE